MVVRIFIDGAWYADNCTEVERKVLTNDFHATGLCDSGDLFNDGS